MPKKTRHDHISALRVLTKIPADSRYRWDEQIKHFKQRKVELLVNIEKLMSMINAPWMIQERNDVLKGVLSLIELSNRKTSKVKKEIIDYLKYLVEMLRLINYSVIRGCVELDVSCNLQKLYHRIQELTTLSVQNRDVFPAIVKKFQSQILNNPCQKYPLPKLTNQWGK